MIKTNFSKNIKLNLISSFITSLVYSSTTPFLIILIAKKLSPEITGIIVMFNIVISFASGIIGGYLADNYQRKPILFIGQIFYGISLFIIVLHLVGFFESSIWLIIGYLLCSIIYSLYGPAYDAILLDSTTQENRLRVYQFEYWTFNLSTALGITIGGFLFDRFLTILFFFCAGLQIILAIYLNKELVYLNKVTENKNTTILKKLISNYATAARDKRWLIFIIGMALFSAAELSLQKYTGIRLAEEFQAITLFSIDINGVKMLSILQAVNTLMVVFFSFSIARLVENKSETAVLISGMLLNVIGYGIIALSNSIYILIPLIVTATIGELASSPIMSSKKANLIPKENQASYLSLSGLSFQGGELFAAFGLTLSGFAGAPVIAGYITGIGVIGTVFTLGSLYENKKWSIKVLFNKPN